MSNPVDLAKSPLAEVLAFLTTDPQTGLAASAAKDRRGAPNGIFWSLTTRFEGGLGRAGCALVKRVSKAAGRYDLVEK